MLDEGSEAGHAAVVGRVADGEDGSCHDPLLNTGREDSWKDSPATPTCLLRSDASHLNTAQRHAAWDTFGSQLREVGHYTWNRSIVGLPFWDLQPAEHKKSSPVG